MAHRLSAPGRLPDRADALTKAGARKAPSRLCGAARATRRAGRIVAALAWTIGPQYRPGGGVQPARSGPET